MSLIKKNSAARCAAQCIKLFSQSLQAGFNTLDKGCKNCHPTHPTRYYTTFYKKYQKDNFAKHSTHNHLRNSAL